MGQFLTKLILNSGKHSSRILLLGLDSAGKTTILYKLKLDENVNTVPTIGFNVETVSPAKGVTFTVWDVGGQERIRQLWEHYYANSHGLIYVVDSADKLRMKEAKKELFGIIENQKMPAGIPVVVIANKQDLPGALKSNEVAEELELRTLTDRRWYIHGACAPTGDGIYESVKAMARMLKEERKSHH